MPNDQNTGPAQETADLPPPPPPEASYFEKLLAYIPAEIVGAVLVMDGMLKEAAPDRPLWLYWAMFFAATLLTPDKLESVDNGMGRSLNFEYDGDNLQFVDDDNERVIEFTIVSDELTAITDPLEEDTTFQYDEPGRMLSYFLPENPSDPMIVNTFDSLDRIASQLDMNDNQIDWYFAGWRSEFKRTTETNGVVSIYDSLGNIVKSVDQLGFETDFVFDGLGRRIEKTMPEGNSTSWTFDQNNNVLTETQTAKPGSTLEPIVRTFTWDATYNKVETAEDGRGNVTTSTYDSLTGNLVKVEKPMVGGLTPTQDFFYNGRGQVLSQLDETGIQTQFVYDTTTEEMTSRMVNTNWKAVISGTASVSDVLTITATDAAIGGGSKAKNYTVQTGDDLEDIAQGLADAINVDSELQDLNITARVSGTAISLSTAAGDTTTFSSSTSGGATATITLTEGLDLTTTLGYNAWGDADSIQDARGNTTAFTFDEKRRLTQIESPSPFNFITNRTYDKNDNLKTVERQTGDIVNPWQIAAATYNLANQVETITLAGDLYTTRLYNEFRQIWKITDGEDRTTEFQYDERRNLATITDPSEVVIEARTYTDNGQIATIEDGRGNVTSYAYDGFDRLVQTVFPENGMTSTIEENVTIDENGNVTEKLTRAGDSIIFEFDALNRLIEKSPASMAVVSFEYDLAGRRSIVRTMPETGNPASGEWKFSYDTAGRLVNEESPDGKNVAYELDENGNVIKLTYPDSWYVERFYDQLNRLTDIKLNGDVDPAAHIEYDQLSRRLSLAFDNDTQINYGFELNDDLSSLAHTFDGSSVTFDYGFNNARQQNSQSVSSAQYLWVPSTSVTTEYDEANPLNQYPEVDSVAFSYNNNGCLTDDGVWSFSYDAENHLISATKSGVSASYVYDGSHRQIQKTVVTDSGTAKIRFVYSGWQRIADYDGSDSLQARYVYGVNLDEPLLQVASGGEVTYMHSDRLGSIVALADETGVVTHRYTYSPWGESNEMSGTTFGFTGQRYDSETGLYYYKRRYYSPKLGRFLQPDPIGFGPHQYSDPARSLNLYQYVNNDPLNNVDRYGEVGFGIYLAIAGVIVLILALAYLLIKKFCPQGTTPGRQANPDGKNAQNQDYTQPDDSKPYQGYPTTTPTPTPTNPLGSL